MKTATFVTCVVTIISVFLINEVRSCTVDGDCLSGGKCVSGDCQCPIGFSPNSDSSKCLPYVTEYLLSRCSENWQCEWMGENSVCQNVCMCKDNYRWYQGECKKFTGITGACSTTMDCFDGYNPQALTCQDQKCVCSDGYYRRNGDCRKKAMKLGDVCALDSDCQSPTHECLIGKCSEIKKKLFKIELDEIEDRKTTFYRVQGDAALPRCEIDANCTTENTNCFSKTKTCTCKTGYFLNDQALCIPEIGVNFGCTKDCPIKPSYCSSDGACYCRDYYFTEDGNRNCVKTMIQTNWNCLSREWCYALGPNSLCSSDNVCKCNKASDLDVDLFCKPNGKPSKDLCSNDLQCRQKVLNSFCIDEACGCGNSRHLSGAKCLPNLGTACDDNDDLFCIYENALCTSGTCSCVDNYVAFNNKCYKEKEAGEDCEVDSQCLARFKNSRCGNGKCECMDNYLLHNKKCFEKKVHGAYCTNLEECRVPLGDTLQCRNNYCVCPTGWKLKDGKCSSGLKLVTNMMVLIMGFVILKALI